MTSPLREQKSITTSSIADLISACARGYSPDLSNLLRVTDEITVSTTSFYEKDAKPKIRSCREEILKDVLDTELPFGPFEPDEAEREHDDEYGREPYIPDIDFESDVYDWEEMADDVFRWEKVKRRETERALEGERDEQEM